MTASPANIGAGADWPAVALEALEYIREKEILLAGLALFFSGKKINENLDAWLSIGQKLVGVTKGCHCVLNRSASILLALFRHGEASKHPLQNMELQQYSTLDRRFSVDDLGDLKPVRDSRILDECREEYLGYAIHHFRVRINEEEVEVLTSGTTVLIRKVEKKNK